MWGASRWRRRTYATGMVLAAIAAAVLAVAALTLHDTHLDLTRERSHTPSAQARAVVAGLARPVRVTYYYQDSDPNGRRALALLEQLAAASPWLVVTGVDPDRQPTLARTAGVKLYNAALIEADGRRLIVHSTDDTELAIGIQRVLREHAVTLCFAEGHHEYSVANAEFANEVERAGQHEHASDAALVLATTPHGIGRWRRSLAGLGYDIRRLVAGFTRDAGALRGGGRRRAAPAVERGRDRRTAPLSRRRRRGLLLFDVGFVIDDALAGLLRDLGATPQPAVVTDAVSHYGTDVETVAVTGYAAHPITQQVAYTYYPGARPLQVTAPDGVQVTALVETSRHARVTATGGTAAAEDPGAQVLFTASEGRLAGGSAPFRAVIGGDADFAANAHFPHLGNGALALGMVRWLAREDTRIATAPRVPVQPLVLLTAQQTARLYLLLVGLLPGLAALLAVLAWWRRR